jgi:hypothetical protein
MEFATARALSIALAGRRGTALTRELASRLDSADEDAAERISCMLAVAGRTQDMPDGARLLRALLRSRDRQLKYWCAILAADAELPPDIACGLALAGAHPSTHPALLHACGCAVATVAVTPVLLSAVQTAGWPSPAPSGDACVHEVVRLRAASALLRRLPVSPALRLALAAFRDASPHLFGCWSWELLRAAATRAAANVGQFALFVETLRFLADRAVTHGVAARFASEILAADAGSLLAVLASSASEFSDPSFAVAAYLAGDFSDPVASAVSAAVTRVANMSSWSNDAALLVLVSDDIGPLASFGSAVFETLLKSTRPHAAFASLAPQLCVNHLSPDLYDYFGTPVRCAFTSFVDGVVRELDIPATVLDPADVRPSFSVSCASLVASLLSPGAAAALAAFLVRDTDAYDRLLWASVVMNPECCDALSDEQRPLLSSSSSAELGAVLLLHSALLFSTLTRPGDAQTGRNVLRSVEVILLTRPFSDPAVVNRALALMHPRAERLLLYCGLIRASADAAPAPLSVPFSGQTFRDRDGRLVVNSLLWTSFWTLVAELRPPLRVLLAVAVVASGVVTESLELKNTLAIAVQQRIADITSVCEREAVLALSAGRAPPEASQRMALEKEAEERYAAIRSLVGSQARAVELLVAHFFDFRGTTVSVGLAAVCASVVPATRTRELASALFRAAAHHDASSSFAALAAYRLISCARSASDASAASIATTADFAAVRLLLRRDGVESAAFAIVLLRDAHALLGGSWGGVVVRRRFLHFDDAGMSRLISAVHRDLMSAAQRWPCILRAPLQRMAEACPQEVIWQRLFAATVAMDGSPGRPLVSEAFDLEEFLRAACAESFAAMLASGAVTDEARVVVQRSFFGDLPFGAAPLDAYLDRAVEHLALSDSSDDLSGEGVYDDIDDDVDLEEEEEEEDDYDKDDDDDEVSEDEDVDY